MAHRFPQVPLKEMDGAMLVMELQRNITTQFSDAGADRIFSAAQVATHLHRDQRRSVRRDLPKVPYIEHPVRNTLRLMRWGVVDADILTATLLHDVPEDCAKEVVELFVRRDGAALRDPQPEHALAWIGEAYGTQVEEIVAAVTNPPKVPGQTTAQKNAGYLEHVRDTVLANPGAVLVKASDLFDNAGSLSSQFIAEPKPGFVKAKLEKYTPVVTLVREHLEQERGSVAANARLAMVNLEASLVKLAERVKAAPAPRAQRAQGSQVDPTTGTELER